MTGTTAGSALSAGAGSAPEPGLAARLRAAWVGWRNRWLADPAFQRWAARMPVARGVARERAGALFAMATGFAHARILHACVELSLFELLARGPLTADTVAARLDLPPASATTLLEAAVSLDLVERLAGPRYALGPLGAAVLGNGGLADMIRHHSLLYADMADTVGLLRRGGGSGALQAYWPYARSDAPGAVPDGPAGAYSCLMARTQAMIAGLVTDAWAFDRHRVILDIGGGEGAFLGEVARAAPRVRLMLFDLPAVAGRAAAAFARDGLAGRSETFGGSFFHDPLPRGADCATLVRVLHDHDDADALRILQAARAALDPGGTLVIAEPLAGTPGEEAMGAAYFGFYLLAMGSGRARTADELAAMARAAGFASARSRPTAIPLLTGMVVCRV